MAATNSKSQKRSAGRQYNSTDANDPEKVITTIDHAEFSRFATRIQQIEVVAGMASDKAHDGGHGDLATSLDLIGELAGAVGEDLYNAFDLAAGRLRG